MNCPFGCQLEDKSPLVYQYDDESYKCSICKARWAFITPPEGQKNIKIKKRRKEIPSPSKLSTRQKLIQLFYEKPDDFYALIIQVFAEQYNKSESLVLKHLTIVKEKYNQQFCMRGKKFNFEDIKEILSAVIYTFENPHVLKSDIPFTDMKHTLIDLNSLESQLDSKKPLKKILKVNFFKHPNAWMVKNNKDLDRLIALYRKNNDALGVIMLFLSNAKEIHHFYRVTSYSKPFKDILLFMDIDNHSEVYQKRFIRGIREKSIPIIFTYDTIELISKKLLNECLIFNENSYILPEVNLKKNTHISEEAHEQLVGIETESGVEYEILKQKYIEIINKPYFKYNQKKKVYFDATSVLIHQIKIMKLGEEINVPNKPMEFVKMIDQEKKDFDEYLEKVSKMNKDIPYIKKINNSK